MTAADCQPTLHVDAELPARAITLELARELERLEPFGAQWPCPVFVTRNLRVVQEPRVMKERHLKLYVLGEDGRAHEAVWWGGAESATATPAPLALH